MPTVHGAWQSHATVCRWLAPRKRPCLKFAFTILLGLVIISLLIRNHDGPSAAEADDNGITSVIGFPSPEQLEAVGWISDDLEQTRGTLPECPKDPPGLGLGLVPALETMLANATETKSSEQWTLDVRRGGWWRPEHCYAAYQTAVVIPYRDREANLNVLLRYLHPILQRQLIHYRIFVAEQDGNGTYNKGRIMNSAFTLIRSMYPSIYRCFVFHDVDMVPEDDRNMYVCRDQSPRHLSPAVDKFNYTLPYKELIGGVLAVTVEQFTTVNGYANVFWGWGGEDDDMYYRIANMGFKIDRPPMEIGRYSMLPHVRRTWISHKKTYDLLGKWRYRQRFDGIKNIKYELIWIKPKRLYTHLLLRFDTEGN